MSRASTRFRSGPYGRAAPVRSFMPKARCAAPQPTSFRQQTDDAGGRFPPTVSRSANPAKSDGPAPSKRRSEEHTSELQSLMRITYAVFCWKNKKKHNTNTNLEKRKINQ